MSQFPVDSDDEVVYSEYYEEIDLPHSHPSKHISAKASAYGLQKPQEGAILPDETEKEEPISEEVVPVAEEQKEELDAFAPISQKSWDELNLTAVTSPLPPTNDKVNIKEWDNDRIFQGSMHLGDKPFEPDEKDFSGANRSHNDIMADLFNRNNQQMMRMRGLPGPGGIPNFPAMPGVPGVAGMPGAIRMTPPGFPGGRGSIAGSAMLQDGKPVYPPHVQAAMIARAGGMIPKDLKYSNFLHPNKEIVDGSWIEKIAWDEDMKDNLPTQLILDLNDPKMLLEKSEEEVVESSEDEDMVLLVEDESEKKTRVPRGTKLRTMLTAHDIAVKRQKEEAKNIDKFNLSNDISYIPKASTHADSDIAHSLPGEKWAACKPHPSVYELRHFHRPRKTFPGSIIKIVPPRKRKRLFTHNDIIRHQRDLSATDGRVILIEFMEESPPVLTNLGMGSKIRNYYRKVSAEDNLSLAFTDGESIYLHPDPNEDRSPFIADIPGGIAVQCIDTNLYKQPIFHHQAKSSDFLLIRSKKSPNKMTIREIPGLYTGGQIFPLKEVPHPGDKSYVLCSATPDLPL